MRRSLLSILCLLVCFSCGSAPSVKEYVLDAKAHVLKGYKPADDKPESFCEKNICYVYEDADVRRIKKYIAQLSEKLKSCQGPGTTK